MMFKTTILKIISQEPMNGYNVRTKLREITGESCSTGTVYPLLIKLENEGYINLTINGRSNVYNITPKGKSQLEYMTKKFNDKLDKMIDVYTYLRKE